MSLDLPAFIDPVRNSQACFRAVLDAMAHPGKIVDVGRGLTPPPPLDPAAAAALLTLADADTPLWLDADPPVLREWLGFHCGVPFSPLPSARFVWTHQLPDLAELSCGSDEAPEDLATIILQVRALGRGDRFRFSGPGLRAPADFSAEGLPPDFLARWDANHATFPRGVDLILTAGSTLAALPRSLRVEG